MDTQNQNAAEKVLENVSKVIIGKTETVRLLLTALLADGHVLLEDVPGTGKTKLAKALAKSLQADYSRIQFTPDLLPGDITGLNIFDRKSNDFVLRKGPVFTNILLADEINRATPRTQAGLLECMEERQVTIDGETYPLSSPFFVIATQNPVETAGTFPLPEAQLDRFMMKLSLGLPSKEEELDILARYLEKDPLTELTGVLTTQELENARQEACKVYIHKAVQEYMVDIVAATRNDESIMMGVSPRGSLALLRCVKAYAWIQGRNFVIPDDVKAVAVPVLAHRIIMDFGRNNYKESVAFIQNILQNSTVPTEDFQV
ncbi:MAG: MoxR family ATPase [Bacillus sp. (in: Bacteria)]|nr:MoxR family ATPase [Bacillus sp. (in: firmicutes)]MCM1427533.1 MoxR family ATPase [Eubacterium sp.]